MAARTEPPVVSGDPERIDGSSHFRRDRRLRLLVVAGIILLALNLRTAVTSVSPVLSRLEDDLGMSTTGAGLLGMLPPFAFAVFGALTPAVIRRAGLERTAWIAMVLAASGQLLRAVSPGSATFLVLSLVALGGMGMGNVVLPPLVKRYFPHRIGLATSGYVLLLSVGTALPPLLAVPVADLADWRVSVGQWSLLAAAAVVPWLVLGARGGATGAHEPARENPAGGAAPAPGRATPPARHYPVSAALRSPVAWGLAALIGMTSLNTYAMFAWLPSILVDAGISESEAGSLLALYSAIGMPLAVLVPWLAARVRNPFPVVLVALVAYAVGYTGLALAPSAAPVVWTVAVGIGPAAFPLSLALVNLRSRTHEGSAVLSGFSQGVGYTVAGTGPLVVAALHEATGGWGLPFAFLAGTLVVQVVGGVVVCRPHRMVEDDLALPAERDPLPEPTS